MYDGAGAFPVKVYWDGGAVDGYAKGGLVDEAHSIKEAGRGGDSVVVHINRDELEQLRQEWGEPTINPETGMPEFFLGGLGKLLKKVGKVALPIAGIAANFIPGIGPLASAAIGAATGAGGSLLNGGGLKGALTGGLMGALPGALKGIGGVAPAAATTAAGAGAGTAGTAMSNAAQTALKAVPAAAGSAASPLALSPLLSTPITSATQIAPTLAAAQGVTPAATTAAPAVTTVAPTAPAARPNFWNRNFSPFGLNTGIPNKFAVPALGLGAIALAGGFKSPKEDPAQSADQFFGQSVNKSSGPGAAASPRPLAVNNRPTEDYARAGYMPEYQYYGMAKGGEVPPMAARPPAKRGKRPPAKKPSAPPAAPSLAVQGPGDGRDDQIDAKLSDGEYVMDAETVSMLGNGSNQAGAKALDGLRVNLRKHKGSKLAKGKISPNAKQPGAYMKGSARG